MSVTITVSDETYQKLKTVAQSKGFEDVEKFLGKWEELELANRREVVDRILEFQNRMGEKYGVMPNSVELVREDRER